jgi:hypothetical protein
MPSLSSLGKRPQCILRNQSTCGFFDFESSFQNWFWNVFSTSGLSQICKIRNVWMLPSPFSRNTLIPCSKTTSWSIKTSFGRKIIQRNGNFSGVILQKKFCMPVFEFIGQIFFQNDV